MEILNNYIHFLNSLDVESSDKVVIIIQLTGLDRIVINGETSPTIASVLKSIKFNWFGMSQNENANNKWSNYFKNEYSEESHLNSLLANLLHFQNEIKDYEMVS